MNYIFDESLPEKPLLTKKPTGLLKSVAGNVMAGFADLAGFGAMLGAGVSGAIEGGADLLGIESAEEWARKRQENFFKFYDEGVKPAGEFWTPDPQTTTQAGKVVGAIGRMAPLFLFGEFAAPLMVGEATMGTAVDLAEQGVDTGTAVGMGVLAGLTNIGLIKMPQAGKTIAGTLGLAATNPVLGALQAKVTKEVLTGAGYEKQAEMYDPFDPAARSVDTVMGLFFGALAHHGRKLQAKAFEEGKAKADAMLEERLQDKSYRDYLETLPIEAEDALGIIRQHQQAIRNMPFDPKKPGQVQTHLDALQAALAALTKDEPVKLGLKARDIMQELSGVYTLDAFRRDLGETFKLADDEAAATIALVEAHAKSRGLSPDEYVRQRIAGIVPGLEQTEGMLYSRQSVKSWPGDFPKMFTHSNAATVINHQDFNAAKTGDTGAAKRIVADLAKDRTIKELSERFPDAIVVSVAEVENTGLNKIPAALASRIAIEGGLKQDKSIISASDIGHKGKDAIQRLLSRKIFTGPVIKGGKYILVDDIITQGGTIHELRHYIVNQGGDVVGVTGLGFSAGSNVIAIKPETITLIRERFGDKEITALLKEHNISGNIEALTEGEGKTLLRFNTLKSLSDRITQEVASGNYPSADEWLRAFDSLNPASESNLLEQKHLEKEGMLYQQVTPKRALGKKFAYSPGRNKLYGEKIDTPEYWSYNEEVEMGVSDHWAMAYKTKDPAYMSQAEVPVKFDIDDNTIKIRYDEDSVMRGETYWRDKYVISTEDVFNHIYDAVTSFSRRYSFNYHLNIPELNYHGTILDFLGEKYYQRHLEKAVGSPVTKGAVQFLEDGRAVIHAFKTADITTIVHEIGHIWRRETAGEDLAILEKWAGVQNGKWEVKHEEKVAKNFERYMSEGIAPTAELKAVFEKFKTWILDIYRKLRGEDLRRDILTPEVRQVFDHWLTPAEQERIETKTDVRAVVTEAATDLHEAARLNGMEPEFLEDMVQGSPEWLELRMGKRMASETPAVMGLSPWVKPRELWELKTGRKQTVVNEAMRIGSTMEDPARQAVNKLHGTEFRPSVVVKGGFGASLDGISPDGKTILEVKVPYQGKESATWKDAEAGKISEHYRIQVQHQLMISGAEEAWFVVHDRNTGEQVRVIEKADPDLQRRITEAWAEFWPKVEADEWEPVRDVRADWWKQYQSQFPDEDTDTWKIGNIEVKQVSAIPDFAELRTSNIPEGMSVHAWTNGKKIFIKSGLNESQFFAAIEHELDHIKNKSFPDFKDEWPQFTSKERPAARRKVKTVNDWISEKGRINYQQEALKGELDILAESNPKVKSLLNKKGKGLSLDRLALMAKDEGYISEATPDALLKAMEEQAVRPQDAEAAIEQQMEAEARKQLLKGDPGEAAEAIVEDFLAGTDADIPGGAVREIDSQGKPVYSGMRESIEKAKADLQKTQALEDVFDRIGLCVRQGG